MAIISITIENFKGIGDAVTIPIRPITLLFGKNSSGKSTVLQALRYLREICEHKDLKFKDKLEALREHEKREGLKCEPKTQAHQSLLEAYKLLQAAHFLYLHDQFDYSKISKSVQTRISKDISNISDADLPDFDSIRQEALNALKKTIEYRTDFESEYEVDDWLQEDDWGQGGIDPDHFTELRSFFSLMHRHELDRKMRIRLEFDITPEKLESLNDILRLAMKPESMTKLKSAWVEMVIGWDEQQKVVYFDSYKYALNGEEWICLTPVNRPIPDEAEWNYEGRCIDLNIYSKKFGLSEWLKDLSWLLGTDNSEGEKFGLSEKKLKNIRPRLEKYVFEDRATNILKKLHDIVLGELDSMRHLGPVRDIRPSDSNAWAMGEAAWTALKQDPQLLKKTNRYMKMLALGYSIRRSEDDEHEILLYDETHKIYHHPLDVGFGISQVIPVVVGALDDSQSPGVFAVEQPELHIHPALQVALGDVFIDGIKNSNRTMLIETHSEHLLLRIMRRMRETFEDRIEENRFPVTPDDIAVLFVEWHDSQTIIREMPVNERGDLVKAWPGGFFEEDIEEVFA